ncbi:hypothetical protein I7I52_09433 [Histoplasma capsulatum]|uniref:Uncharacterized protein n=1 Tax=Ajellomyces capsulatus TaxID=5037 RepID=A0A8H7Z163_AJECA|nr:hypothetical protein I7I52_09433 [Histoplasma capsulatum]
MAKHHTGSSLCKSEPTLEGHLLPAALRSEGGPIRDSQKKKKKKVLL